jgi:hypothetical protein
VVPGGRTFLLDGHRSVDRLEIRPETRGNEWRWDEEEVMRGEFHDQGDNVKQGTGNRYQARSEAIFSSFSSSRSNRDVTSFPRNQFSK